MTLKHTFVILCSIVLFHQLKAKNIDTLYFGGNISTDFPITLGNNLKNKFWAFPADTNSTIATLRVKRRIYPGLIVGSSVIMTFKNKTRGIEFLIEANIGYCFRKYDISWDGNYTTDNSYKIEYKIQRHDFLASTLCGLKYNGLLFRAGISLMFSVPVVAKVNYAINEHTFSQFDVFVKSGTRKYFNVTCPISCSYIFNIGKIAIGPTITYSLGLYDLDDFAIGGVRNRTVARNDFLSVGVLLLLKK